MTVTTHIEHQSHDELRDDSGHTEFGDGFMTWSGNKPRLPEKKLEDEIEFLRRNLASAKSGVEKFEAIRGFETARSMEISVNEPHLDFDEQEKLANTAFGAYDALYRSTDSVYLRRVLESGMNNEIHRLELWPLYTTNLTDEEWEEWFYEGAHHNAKVKLNDQGEQLLAEHPEYQALLEYCAKAMEKNPTIMDGDYYSPNPYRDIHDDIAHGEARTDKFDSPFELNMETAALLHIKVNDLSSEAHTQLLEFGVGLNKERYDHTRETTKNLSDDMRLGLAEALLATEFGDDFGDKILTIAEHTTPEQAKAVFALVGKYREESKLFAGEYAEFDPGLAESLQKAMNERLTDLLAAVAHVAARGEATIDTAPHQDKPGYKHTKESDITLQSVDEVIETMRLLQATYERRRSIINDPDMVAIKTVENEAKMGYQIYRYHSDTFGDALLQIRKDPNGAGDFAREYGSDWRGVSSTISWICSPEGYFLAGDKDPRGVSIRLDRDGHKPDEVPGGENEHAMNWVGTVSLDISTGHDNGKRQSPRPQEAEASKVPLRIGRTIAAGNILRAQEIGGNVSLYHNTNYFDQEKYGTIPGFRSIVEFAADSAEMDVLESEGRLEKLKKTRIGRTAIRRTRRPVSQLRTTH